MRRPAELTTARVRDLWTAELAERRADARTGRVMSPFGRFCCKSPVQGLELARVVKRCDLGALAPTLFTQLRRYAMPEPQQVAVVSPMLRAAVGSERWLQEQTRPEHRAGRAIAVDRVSGCASSAQTASRSSCARALIARRPRSRQTNAQYHERLRADRVVSCGTGPSDSTAL